MCARLRVVRSGGYVAFLNGVLPVAALLVFSSCVVGCASTSPSIATVAGLSGPSKITGSIRLRSGMSRPGLTDATVGVSWYRKAEIAQLQDPRHMIYHLLSWVQRLRILRGVDLSQPGARVPYELPYEGGEVVIMAVLDQAKAFWETAFGGGADGNLIHFASRPVESNAEGLAHHDIVFDRRRDEQRLPEVCAGPRFRLLHIEAPEVAGTVGNSTRRRVCVYLPPSYESAAERRYPVVYALPGLSGTDQSAFRARRGRKHLGQLADALAKETGRELIIASVDSSNRLGSSYFVRSPLTGDWASFLTRRVVAEMDRRFRTEAQPKARALLGHSTGGFNAVSLGLRFPTVFQTVAASAPDALDFGPWLAKEGRAIPLWLAWMRVEDAVEGPGQLVSYAADWSPEPSAPRGFVWPIDLSTGLVRPKVMQRWLEHSPSELLKRPQILEPARRLLSGRILLAPSSTDEFRLYPPAQRFHQQLLTAEIAHEWKVWSGGHASHGEARMSHALRFVLECFAR